MKVIVKGLLDIPGKFESARRVYSTEGISPTILTAQGGGIVPKILIRHDEG